MTLAQQLGKTIHCSLLMKKACRQGIATIDDAISLAVSRGCHHYVSEKQPPVSDPGPEKFTTVELIGLLLLGNQPYSPLAIRCAAQLMTSADAPAELLVKLAEKERFQDRLRYIAEEALSRNAPDPEKWRKICDSIDEGVAVVPGVLPHGSRFVSSSGFHRGKMMPDRWLSIS